MKIVHVVSEHIDINNCTLEEIERFMKPQEKNFDINNCTIEEINKYFGVERYTDEALTLLVNKELENLRLN
jgi:hypothetical protein